LHENYLRSKRERDPNHPSPPFKEKEKGGEGGSMLGGQWKIPWLVVMEFEGRTPFHLFQFPLTTLL